MAKKDKNFDKALSKAIDELEKGLNGAMRKAVQYAMDQAGKDLMGKAKSCLLEYYEWEPERYDRINILQYAFLPYTKKLRKTGDKLTGAIGVEYSAEALEAHIGGPVTYIGKDGVERIKHVGYYGSAKHQPVDAWWVIENYLLGLHPDGGSERGSFHADAVSPDQKMNLFIENYGKTFDENVLIGLMGQISKKM